MLQLRDVQYMLLLPIFIVLLTVEISAQVDPDKPIFLNTSSILITPETVSCGGSSSSNIQSKCNFVDGDLMSSWTIPPENVSISFSFSSGPSIVNRVRLHHNITDTSGFFVGITLRGSRRSWLTTFSHSCQDLSQYSESDREFFNCIEFSELENPNIYEIKLNQQFLFRSTNGSLLWWESFHEISVVFAHVNGSQKVTNNITVQELEVFGWKEPASACNCHPLGVLRPEKPCNELGNCVCNLLGDNSDQHCVPSIHSLVPYGPIDGGTKQVLESNVNSSSQVSVTVTIGGSYGCKILNRVDKLTICNTSKADANQLYKSLPITVCWTISIYGVEYDVCRQLSERFQYRPTPVILNFQPRATVTSGGIRLTVRGEHLDSVFVPRPSINVFTGRKIFPRDFPQESIICDVISGGEMICPTPVMNDDLGTSFIEAYLQVDMDDGIYSNATAFSDSQKKDFSLAIKEKIDFQNFGTITYDPKKEAERFIQVYTTDKTQWLQIIGSKEDYSVTVGNVPAREVTVNAMNVLNFKPPLEEPPPRKDDVKGAKSVTVRVGFLKVWVGNIKYGGAGPNVPLIVGLCVGLGGAALLAVLIACIVRNMRTKSIAGHKPTGILNVYDRGTTGDPVGLPLQSEPSEAFITLLPPELQPKVRLRLINFSQLTLGSAVGRGNFGKVYKGTLRKDGTTEVVAIKTLKDFEQGQQTREASSTDVYEINLEEKVKFLEEATMMIEFTHKNVLSLKNIAIQNGNPYVVLPYMEHGDLKSYISNRSNNLSVATLLQFGLQVAEGMEYLTQKKYIHRDLAARNCMVDKDLCVKVADFGLARDVFQGDYYRPTDHNRPLPIKWMAIECLTEYEFTVHSDVWSYGVLLWELITKGEKPYPKIDMEFMFSYLKQGKRLLKPDLASDVVYKLMLDCWKEIPNQRPTFTEIIERLTDILTAAGQESRRITTEPENTRNRSAEVNYDRSKVAHSYLELSVPQAVSNDYLTTETPHSDAE